MWAARHLGAEVSSGGDSPLAAINLWAWGGGGLTRSFDEDTSTHAVLARFSAALARIDADERDAEVAAVATASASGADSNTTVQQDGANSNTTILQQDVDHVNEQHSAHMTAH
eukprot:jgi/Chrpa1/20188/Chrysochromulina_OHIO_Genome00005405-RA